MYYRDRETKLEVAQAYVKLHKKLAADRLKAIAAKRKTKKAD